MLKLCTVSIPHRYGITEEVRAELEAKRAERRGVDSS